MSKKATWVDGVLASQVRDIQGEMLDVAGADISELEAGRGRWNDNHGAGAFNSLGIITDAKKIFKEDDCDNERHRYYWEKIKAPYIYGRGYLFDDEDHPNARAAAAILRSVHRNDCPLKLKLSVEGGVVSRGIKDPSLLARTKIHSCAITFTPANTSTLAEPLNLDKTAVDWEADLALMKSVMHLAKTDIPSFRAITRNASADMIVDKLNKAREMASELGFKTVIPEVDKKDLIIDALQSKLSENVNKINELVSELRDDSGLNKALTAGYGGGSAPSDRTGGSVLQTESLDSGRKGFKYIKCFKCGHEQPHLKYQVKCSKCQKSFPFADLYKVMVGK